ncbi:hypothetical protein JCM5353_003764 [Sporobolomyces roseus]
MPTTSEPTILVQHHLLSLSLPDELWIQVLLELDYFQLKKASRICKKLKRIIQDSKFDKVLFRAVPPSPALRRGDRVTIHPALGNTECIVHAFDGHPIYSEKGNEHFLKDIPHLLNETATSPASAVIQMILLATERPHTLHRQTGVTIGDGLEELTRFWNSKPMLFS